MITASTSSRLTAEAMPAPSASTARSISSVGELVAVLERVFPDRARQARAVVLLGQLEQIGLGALLMLAPRAGLHRRAPGVGLHAAAPPAGALGAVELDDHVADLPGAATAEPRLAVEDQPAADAGAPEDAEHRVIRLAGAERELGLGRHLDVVADQHRGPELRPRAPSQARMTRPSWAGCARGRRHRFARQRHPATRRRRPTSAADSTPACFAAPLSACAICDATSDGPPSVGVGSRDCPRTCCSSSTTIASILVPPRSIPPRSRESLHAAAGYLSPRTPCNAPARGSARRSRRPAPRASAGQPHGRSRR